MVQVLKKVEPGFFFRTCKTLKRKVALTANTLQPSFKGDMRLRCVLCIVQVRCRRHNWVQEDFAKSRSERCESI
jgi:hypothetical protein